MARLWNNLVYSVQKATTRTGACEHCGAKGWLPEQDRFCDADCAAAWREHQAQINEVGRGAACVYPGCRSTQRALLKGRFCSEFCQTQQLRIDQQRNDAIKERLERKMPLDVMMREVNALQWEMPPYGGPTELASDLFGVAETPRKAKK